MRIILTYNLRKEVKQLKAVLSVIAILILMIFGIFVSCDRDLCCDDETYIISGRVIDSLITLPIDSAIVSLFDTSYVDEPFLTDSNGNYSIPLYGDRALVFVRRQGYLTKSKSLKNISSDISKVNFELAPE